MSRRNPEPHERGDVGKRTPLHAAVAILASRWRDLNRDLRNHGRRLHRHDDRLTALEVRLLMLENTLNDPGNTPQRPRNPTQAHPRRTRTRKEPTP